MTDLNKTNGRGSELCCPSALLVSRRTTNGRQQQPATSATRWSITTSSQGSKGHRVNGKQPNHPNDACTTRNQADSKVGRCSPKAAVCSDSRPSRISWVASIVSCSRARRNPGQCLAKPDLRHLPRLSAHDGRASKACGESEKTARVVLLRAGETCKGQHRRV